MNATSEKVRIIVLFGDISGFTSFCDSLTNDEIEYDPFMEEFDDLIDKTAQDTGYSFTDTGDGFMCTVDLQDGHNCKRAIEVILNLWKLLKKIERLIAKKDSPRPDGFRIVGAAGYVKRKVMKDGRVILRGKHINMAHNFLDQARGKGFVCHESLKQLISDVQAKKHGFQFTSLGGRLETDRRRSLLWVLKIG